MLKYYLELIVTCLWKDKRSKIAIVIVVLLTCVDIFAAILAPKFLGILAQSYKEIHTISIAWVMALLVICWVINTTFTLLCQILFLRVVLNRAIHDFRLKVIMQLHKIPWHVQKEYNMSEVIKIANRVSPSLKLVMNTSFVTIIPSLLKVIALSITMIHTNYHTCYFPFVISLICIYVFLGIGRFACSKYNSWSVSDYVAGATQDSLNNTKFAKYYIDLEKKRLSKLFYEEERQWERNTTYLYTTRLAQTLLFVLAAGGLIFHMTMKLHTGQLTISQFTTIHGCIFTIYKNVENAIARTKHLLVSMLDIGKALKILTLVPNHANKPFTKNSHTNNLHTINSFNGISKLFNTNHKKVNPPR